MENTPSQPPFKIGDKVVCVDLTLRWNEKFVGVPKVKYGQITEVTYVQYLNEITKDGGKRIGWYVEVLADLNFLYFYDIFALVQPRHQNVEIAQDILELKIVEERADVLIPETI